MYCFCRRFLSVNTITHEPLHSAWWNSARTCTVTTARTLFRFKVIGQGQFFVRGPKFTKLFSPNVDKIVAHNAVIRLSIAWSVPEIFAIKVQSCPKSRSTREPLHLPWWNFAGTCIFRIARHPENFKVIGQMSRSHRFPCVWCCGYPRTVLSLDQGLMILKYKILLMLAANRWMANRWLSVNQHNLRPFPTLLLSDSPELFSQRSATASKPYRLMTRIFTDRSTSNRQCKNDQEINIMIMEKIRVKTDLVVDEQKAYGNWYENTGKWPFINRIH